MRVSAVVVGESTQEMVKVIFAQQPQREEAFYRYLRHRLGNRITCHSARRRNISTPLLAGLCVGYAAERHAGTKSRFAPAWVTWIYRWVAISPPYAKSSVQGMALRASQFDIHNWLKYRELDDRGKRILLPNQFEYYRDSNGLLPLLANVAAVPAAAARTSIQCLTL